MPWFDPLNFANNVTIVTVFSQRSELHDAVRSLEKACGIDPDFAEPFASLAVILNELGRYDDAERCYMAAVKLKPHDPHAHNNLGVFHSNRGGYTNEEKLCSNYSIKQVIGFFKKPITCFTEEFDHSLAI